MNCRNGGEYVTEAIESVLNQTFVDWELIFWDNQSTDNTAIIVKNYSDIRIKYFLSTTPDNLGCARDKAIKTARGEFIAFLDSDDKWRPKKLEKVIPLFQDPAVGLAYSNCLQFDGRSLEKNIYTNSGCYAEGFVFLELLSRYFLNLQTVVLRKSALTKFEPIFDPSLKVSEEADLFLRVSHDWKLAMVDEVLAEYRVHSKSDSWKKTDLFVKESKVIIEKLSSLFPLERDSIKHAGTGMLDTSYWSCAVSSLIRGNNSEMRKFVRMMSNKRLKHKVAYWGSYLPGFTFLKLLRYFKYIHTD